MGERPILIGLGYSPWTQRARWSLDVCGFEYQWQKYQPFLGEPGLRIKLGKWSGPVTVPVLLTKAGNVEGGFAIARYAAAKSGPEGFWDDTLCAHWERLADKAVAEARDALFPRIEQDEQALCENVAGLPFANTGAMQGLAKWVLRRMRKKYADTVRAGAMRNALEELRLALQNSSGDYISKVFSYADIAAVTMLDGVKPVSEDYIRQGPASRRCWTDEALASEYADLLEWRDQICEQHRKKLPKR